MDWDSPDGSHAYTFGGNLILDKGHPDGET